jgi:hypothetical protein
MDLVTIGAGEDKVWINPAHIEWFWNHGGKLCVKLVGEREMQTFEGITAEEFERTLNSIPAHSRNGENS